MLRDEIADDNHHNNKKIVEFIFVKKIQFLTAVPFHNALFVNMFNENSS